MTQGILGERGRPLGGRVVRRLAAGVAAALALLACKPAGERAAAADSTGTAAAAAPETATTAQGGAVMPQPAPDSARPAETTAAESMAAKTPAAPATVPASPRRDSAATQPHAAGRTTPQRTEVAARQEQKAATPGAPAPSAPAKPADSARGMMAGAPANAPAQQPAAQQPAAQQPAAPSAERTVAQAGGGTDSLAVTKEEYDGWKYFHVYCFRCHGTDAFGGQLAPDLRHSVGPEGSVTKEVFIQTVTNGRPEKGMPTWGGLLTQDQILHLYAYVKARSERRLAPGRPHLKPGEN